MNPSAISSAAQLRRLTQADFDRFALLSRDDNPIHCDPVFARGTRFGATVAHGMLLFSILSGRLGSVVSRPGLTVAQTLMFPAPTYVDDQVRVHLSEIRGGSSKHVNFEITLDAERDRGQTPVLTMSGVSEIQLEPDAAWFERHAAQEAVARQTSEPAAMSANGADAAETLYHLRLAQTVSSTRVFTDADLAEYAALSGDHNAFHLDPAFARARGFAGALIPLPLLAGMFSDLLGTRLPGRGTGWMKQSLRLRSPALAGEPITASVRIVRIRADKHLVNLATEIRGANGRLVLEGEALVLVRDLEDKRPAREGWATPS